MDKPKFKIGDKVVYQYGDQTPRKVVKIETTVTHSYLVEGPNGERIWTGTVALRRSRRKAK